MDISKFVAKIIGIYLLIVSSAMLVNMHQFNSYVTSLINYAPLMFVTGFFTLIVGLLMVVSHNVWQWNWRVLITVIAWLTVIKGASLILCPQLIDKITIIYMQNVVIAYGAAGFDLILGAVLCYLGFKR